MNSLNLLEHHALFVARALIGYEFYRVEPDGGLTGGRIIETEAYTEADAASHSYRGPTARTEVMFGPAGRLYVYFTYGLHWCTNIVCGPAGQGEAVLLRALVPLEGLERMQARRGPRAPRQLTSGPAKLAQALAITGADNGALISGPDILLKSPARDAAAHVSATPRIGITRDTHRLWRFISSR